MNKGFTLVELMVVISIIAILSVVGMVVYSKVQKNTRDARRHADIDAIASALEVKHNETNSYAIVSEAEFGSKYFGSGTIPAPPEGGSYTKITSDNGFKVCAKLEDNDSSGCAVTNPGICYCQKSLYGVLGAGDANITGLAAGTKIPLAHGVGDANGDDIVTGPPPDITINDACDSADYAGTDVCCVLQVSVSSDQGSFCPGINSSIYEAARLQHDSVAVGSATEGSFLRRLDFNGKNGVTSTDMLCIIRYLADEPFTSACSRP